MPDPAGAPKAYLNYLAFDLEHNPITIDPANPPWVNVSPAAASGTAERLALEYIAQTDGYLYIYVANETQEDVDVYFDDLTITHTGISVIQSTDYYPFGLVMREEKNEPYRFGYQGQFAEKDGETGWNHFELRQYDSRIGRWLAVDPYRQYYSPYVGMGNNPVSHTDRSGGCVGDDCEPVARYGDCKCSTVSQATGDRITWVSSYEEAAELGLDLFEGGQLHNVNIEARDYFVARAVLSGREAAAPFAYGVVLAPAFLYYGSTAYLTNVGKNIVFEFGSQMLSNNLDYQRAIQSMDLMDITTGSRFSRYMPLAMSSGMIDYTLSDGIKVIGYNKSYIKGISDGIINATIGQVSNYGPDGSIRPVHQEAVLEIFGGYFEEQIGESWR